MEELELADNQYQCASCKEIFDKDEEDWTDEQAMSEALDEFGMELFETGIAVVCDDCYQQITRGNEDLDL